MKSKVQKTEEGATRNAEWRKLTPQQQLATLDRRLGKNVGAKRQRKKLTRDGQTVVITSVGPEPAYIHSEPAAPKTNRLKHFNKKATRVKRAS